MDTTSLKPPEGSPCPCCGSIFRRLTLLPVVFTFGSGHLLNECGVCRATYFEPAPKLSDLETFYSVHPYEFNLYSQESRAKTIAKNFLNLYPQAKFLDVGCATGFLLNALKERTSWELHGVELVGKAAAFAREKLGLQNVLNADLESAAFSGAHFDIVHISEVLEHVPDPIALLCECRRILKPGGTFLLSLPNGLADRQGMLDYWRLHGEAPGHASGHIFFFSKHSLECIARRAGFEIVSGETYAFKQGLRSLGLFPKRRGWQGMFSPRHKPEVANTADITVPKGRHSAFYYRLKYGVREQLKVPGLHRFGLGWDLVLKPIA